jgi:hypothetical protein
MFAKKHRFTTPLDSCLLKPLASLFYFIDLFDFFPCILFDVAIDLAKSVEADIFLKLKLLLLMVKSKLLIFFICFICYVRV